MDKYTRIDQTTIAHSGRKFQQYSIDHNAKILPVDETEEDRVEFINLQLKIRLGRINLTPLDRPSRVLDCGCGPGSWAEDLDEEVNGDLDNNSEPCEIIGIDIYTDNFDEDENPNQIQTDSLATSASDDDSRRLDNDDPSKDIHRTAEEIVPEQEADAIGSSPARHPRVLEAEHPPHSAIDAILRSEKANPPFSCKVIWDLNKSLRNSPLYRKQEGTCAVYKPRVRFDLVNIRNLSEGVITSRWRPLLNELYDVLLPEGWLQVIDCDFGNIQSRSGLLYTDHRDCAHGLARWIECYRNGMDAIGRHRRIGEDVASVLASLEYVDVRREIHQFNIGAWQVGCNVEMCNQMLDLVERSLEPLGLWFACGILGMDRNDFNDLVESAKIDLRNPRIKPYLEWNVVTGRRPTTGHMRSSLNISEPKVITVDHDTPEGRSFQKPYYSAGKA